MRLPFSGLPGIGLPDFYANGACDCVASQGGPGTASYVQHLVIGAKLSGKDIVDRKWEPSEQTLETTVRALRAILCLSWMS
jgi:hypothetical protein